MAPKMWHQIVFLLLSGTISLVKATLELNYVQMSSQYDSWVEIYHHR